MSMPEDNMTDSMEITKSLLGLNDNKTKDKSYARLKDCENMMLQVGASTFINLN